MIILSYLFFHKKFKKLNFIQSLTYLSERELHSHVHLFVTPWTVACQAPLSMEFSKQEYLNELPFSFSRDLPSPRFEHESSSSPADSLPSEAQGKPTNKRRF